MSGEDRWIFGYGSLVWRPDFAFRERAAGTIHGFARRFWQGSPDHRGVPEAPGRVVTLVPEATARCIGMAYRVSAATWRQVLHRLDARESGGFERLEVTVHFQDPSRGATRGLVYVASEGNPNFLGPAPLEEMVAQVRRARGHSGTNREYVLRLAESLEALGVCEEHVAGLAARLREPA